MTVLKVLGVLVGAFLLLGLGFIEPTKNMQDLSARGLIITGGVIICGALATYWIRRLLKQERRARHE